MNSRAKAARIVVGVDGSPSARRPCGPGPIGPRRRRKAASYVCHGARHEFR